MSQNDPQIGGEVALFEAPDGQIRLDVRLEHDTVWLTQAQMVELFGRDQSVISRHIGNTFKEGELERESNMQKMHIANSDKPVEVYSLDVVISVGYRVKSLRGTQFRIAANLGIEMDDFEYAPFAQEGGLGKVHQLFGPDLTPIMENLNTVLVA